MTLSYLLHRLSWRHVWPLSSVSLVLLVAVAKAGSGPEVSLDEFQETKWMNYPLGFALEARTVERDAAAGLHVVRPIFNSARFNLLAEGYGYKGEGRLGIAGAGLIARRVAGRGFVEANAFFDALRSTDGYGYPQVGVGLAYSQSWFTLRANGYLPFASLDRRRTSQDRWQREEGRGDDRRRVRYTRDRYLEREAMRGFDVEAELRLPKPPTWVDPRVAVGYAYRDAEERPEVFSGVTARGELHFSDLVVAGAEWRQDQHGVGQEWRVGVRVQIPFGGPGEVPPQATSQQWNGPATRFPWPTVVRGREERIRRESSRLPRRAASNPEAGAGGDGCCVSDDDPLIFN